jgi:hypothetical protein
MSAPTRYSASQPEPSREVSWNLRHDQARTCRTPPPTHTPVFAPLLQQRVVVTPYHALKFTAACPPQAHVLHKPRSPVHFEATRWVTARHSEPWMTECEHAAIHPPSASLLCTPLHPPGGHSIVGSSPPRSRGWPPPGVRGCFSSFCGSSCSDVLFVGFLDCLEDGFLADALGSGRFARFR